MRLFKRSADLPTAWDAKPWWRKITLDGLSLGFFGALSMFYFVLGAITGDALFALPSKFAGSGAIEASLKTSPVLYFVLMGANLISICVIVIIFLVRREEHRAVAAEIVARPMKADEETAEKMKHVGQQKLRQFRESKRIKEANQATLDDCQETP
jgi:hypothetical protein